MDLLRTVPLAAPIVLRHLAAYAELAGEDLLRARRELADGLIASTLIVMSSFFTVAMLCLAVIARTWDTPNRVMAIAWMGAAFALLLVAAALYRSRLLRARTPFLSSVKSELAADRLALDRIMSKDGV
jgi:uncharacterized membrane protein YqjE